MAKQSRPFIGINADFISASKRSIAYLRLDTGYADVVLAAGGIPIILPPLNKASEFNAVLDRLDGVIMSGGLDMDPRRQQQPMHAAIQAMAERREENDRILMRCLLERQMPLLAVGLGMQELNSICGGNLYLHLPEDLPRAMPHFDPTGGPHRHLVLLEPNTRLEEIYGGIEIRVNSSHHQAVRQVAPKLRVSAGPRRGYRGHRGGRPELVLHWGSVASGIGYGIGLGHAVDRMFHPGIGPAGPAIGAGGLSGSSSIGIALRRGPSPRISQASPRARSPLGAPSTSGTSVGGTTPIRLACRSSP